MLQEFKQKQHIEYLTECDEFSSFDALLIERFLLVLQGDKHFEELLHLFCSGQSPCYHASHVVDLTCGREKMGTWCWA